MMWDWEGVKVWEIIVLAFKMTKAPGEIIWGGGERKIIRMTVSRTDTWYAQGEIRSFINTDWRGGLVVC